MAKDCIECKVKSSTILNMEKIRIEHTSMEVRLIRNIIIGELPNDRRRT